MAQDLIVRTVYNMLKKVITHKVKEFVKRIVLLQSFTSVGQICKSLLLLKS